MTERQKIAVLDVVNRFLRDGDGLNMTDDVRLVVEVQRRGRTVRRLRYSQRLGRTRVYTRSYPAEQAKPPAVRRLENLVNLEDLSRLDDLLG